MADHQVLSSLYCNCILYVFIKTTVVYLFVIGAVILVTVD